MESGEVLEILLENDTEVIPGTNECSSMTNEPFEWTDATVQLLISEYKESRPIVGGIKMPSLCRMWNFIRKQFEEYGYIVSCKVLEQKWRSLERAFRKAQTNKKKTGRGRKTCPYEEQLNEILAAKHNVAPPVIASTFGLQCTAANKSSCDVEPSPDEEPRPSSSSPSSLSIVDSNSDAEENVQVVTRHKPNKKRVRKSSYVSPTAKQLEKLTEDARVREENRKRRHEEKMDLLKELLNLVKENNST